MDFQIDRVSNPNLKAYKKHDLDTAYEFSKAMYKEFGAFLKAIILFGSITRPNKKEDDIDVLLIVDDVTVKLTADFVEAYRVITDKKIMEISPRLHLTTMKLTDFWDYLRKGDPILFNMLRDGVPLLDTGFFEPLQSLLKQGRIRPTKESIWTYYTRAPMTVQRAKWHILQATNDLYWAVIDASHACLMAYGEVPPSPDHVADMIEKKLVARKILPKKYSQTMKYFYELSKKIQHREIDHVTGLEYDRYAMLANEYIAKMRELIEKQSGHNQF